MGRAFVSLVPASESGLLTREVCRQEGLSENWSDRVREGFRVRRFQRESGEWASEGIVFGTSVFLSYNCNVFFFPEKAWEPYLHGRME